tara:strand:+ start:4812 stop:5432 length:621 start_codon:yes stop_codon:yes gene_type:complete
MNNKDLFLFSIFILSGCSSFNLDSVTSLGQKFMETRSESGPYFIKEHDQALVLNLDNNKRELFVLDSSINNLDIWKNDEDISLISFNGKLLRSYGYNNNFDIVFDSNIQEYLYMDNGHVDTYISLSNPNSGLLEMTLDYKLIKSGKMSKFQSNEIFEYDLIEESFNVPKIYWKGKNYYWIDKNLKVWKSKQIINPNGDKIYIDLLK